MNKEAKLLVFSLAFFFAVSALPFQATANHEYVAAFFTSTQATAYKAFLENDFAGTTPSAIPSGSFLSSVVSIAGQTSSSPCPCLYQTGFLLYSNGTVQATSQFYGMQYSSNGGCIYCSWIWHAGTVSALDYDGEINYISSCSCIQSSAYVYSTHTQLDQNSPNIYRFSKIYTGDVTNPFYYGLNSASSCYGEPLQRYQAGIESPSIGSGSWHVNQRSAEVYTTSWIYQKGEATLGNLAYITCLNGQVDEVGGAAMTGVNLNSGSTFADSPSWKYTGSTIAEDTSIWSTTGGSMPYACQISGRC